MSREKISRYKRLITRRKNAFSFLFISDVHWGANQRKSPKMIKSFVGSTNLRNVFFGWDFITYSDTNKSAMIKLGQDFMNDRLYLLPIEGLPSEQCMTAVVLNIQHNIGYTVRLGRG